jgi:predicted RNA binding protein YcfA (HicA-like mRNA interferase family)
MMRKVINITSIEKLEARIRQKPTPNDIRFNELVKFMDYYGFELRPSSGGSHRVFCHPQYDGIVSVVKPHGTSDGVKRAYIRKALEAVDELNMPEEE